jgi:hypothetical protein
MMIEKRIKTRFMIVLLLLLVMYIPLYTLQLNKILALTFEDHLYENFQAICFLLASLLMFYLYFQTKAEDEKFIFNTNRNLFLLFLAIFLFFCFGEEISWGQRIFGIATPSEMQKLNSQDEINIHNLWIFETFKEQGKHGLALWFSSQRVFALIWLIYCFLIPVSNHFSTRLHTFYKKINFPLVPIWLGSLFVIAHIISKIVEHFWLYYEDYPVSEIKEANFTFLYLLVGLVFLEAYLKSRPKLVKSHCKNESCIQVV